MKLTRRELDKIIRESLNIDEGFFDSVKKVLSKAASAVGGAVLSAVDRVDLGKRSDDLVGLYNEYNQLIAAVINPSKAGISSETEEMIHDEFLGGAGSSKMRSVISNWNCDLIKWLEDDGMDAEAEMVLAALEEKGVKRNEKPA